MVSGCSGSARRGRASKEDRLDGDFLTFVRLWSFVAARPLTALAAVATVAALIILWTSTRIRSQGMLLLGSGQYFVREVDILIMIYMTASKDDVDRFRAASSSWLSRTEIQHFSVDYIGLLCADDPDLPRVYGQDNVAFLPCRHGYENLITKGVEGYKYVSAHYRTKYVIKTDVDTVLPLDCMFRLVRDVDPAECPSFGMGLWYPGNQSEVWRRTDQPYGLKFHNDEYIKDTGHKFYAPYPSGWAIIWTGDVARFLGMFGQEGPRWRSSWKIDDAAIGTFMLGLDICRLPLTCHVVAGLEPSEVKSMSSIQESSESGALPVASNGAVEGFEGPLLDDVPGFGDLGNTQASSLGNCANRCALLPRCVSFEFSPTAGHGENVQNCQLASNATQSGKPFRDFALYLRKRANAATPAPAPALTLRGASSLSL
eukprot:TRINITY_DN65166_c0_g1_i1.p1 TRINITY_DN65166_c0_g1~~TRINITY_DN65166_c0_g1_i1.p1  ORF type:complete len:428 (-),score=64.63 TRINITY_DN65166_c0_g1_i1:28-1311(-)